MKPVSFTSLLFATTAFADQYVVDSLKNIIQATQDYHNSLSNWDGSYLGGLVVWRKSVNLVSDLNAISSNPRAQNLTAPGCEEDDDLDKEGFGVAYNLVDEIKAAVDTAISMKSKYEAIPVLGTKIALRNLHSIRNASASLSELFGPNVPETRLDESKDLVKQIDEQFARAIAALEDGGSTKPSE